MHFVRGAFSDIAGVPDMIKERPRTLVVGIGNPDRGDDGFSAAVIARLRGHTPAGVQLLARKANLLALIDDWDGCGAVILVDAAMPVNGPGRVHRIDLAENPLPLGWVPPSSHAFGLAETVELARNLGRLPHRLILYLVEGQSFETGAPLSPAVVTAINQVAERILADFTPHCGCTNSMEV
jgi:hydrogenase maturation protease